MGNKLKTTALTCDDDDRRRSIDSDQEIEEQTHCATFDHTQHYMNEVYDKLD